jgi:hypothetical protein
MLNESGEASALHIYPGDFHFWSEKWLSTTLIYWFLYPHSWSPCPKLVVSSVTLNNLWRWASFWVLSIVDSSYSWAQSAYKVRTPEWPTFESPSVYAFPLLPSYWLLWFECGLSPRVHVSEAWSFGNVRSRKTFMMWSLVRFLCHWSLIPQRGYYYCGTSWVSFLREWVVIKVWSCPLNHSLVSCLMGSLLPTHTPTVWCIHNKALTRVELCWCHALKPSEQWAKYIS